MLELRRLFARETVSLMHTGVDLKDFSVEEISEEYRACILEVFASARIERACFTLDVSASGPLKDGRHLLTANIRLVKWDRISGVRLLVGLPVLERGVRRALAKSWAFSSAHFGGLWLHPSGQILERPLMKELGRDLGMLESAGTCALHDDSIWASDSGPERKSTDWAALR